MSYTGAGVGYGLGAAGQSIAQALMAAHDRQAQRGAAADARAFRERQFGIEEQRLGLERSRLDLATDEAIRSHEHRTKVYDLQKSEAERNAAHRAKELAAYISMRRGDWQNNLDVQNLRGSQSLAEIGARAAADRDTEAARVAAGFTPTGANLNLPTGGMDEPTVGGTGGFPRLPFTPENTEAFINFRRLTAGPGDPMQQAMAAFLMGAGVPGATAGASPSSNLTPMDAIPTSMRPQAPLPSAPPAGGGLPREGSPFGLPNFGGEPAGRFFAPPARPATPAQTEPSPAPTAGDSLSARRAHYDALVEQFGKERVVKEIGPRP